MQSYSDEEAVKSEANPDPPQKQTLPESMESSEADRKRKYHQAYYQAHKKQFIEYSRKEYRRNIQRYRTERSTPEYRAKRSAYLKRYRTVNRDSVRAGQKEWYLRNRHTPEYKEKNRKIAREWYRRNTSKEVARRKRYAEKYPDRIRARFRKLRKESVQFMLRGRFRATVNRAFRRNWIEKPNRTEALMGCSIAEAKAHIESQFVNGMSWSNRRSFVIDHIVPVAAFDLRNPEHVSIAFNWRNLQPLSPEANSAKSDTIPAVIPDWIPTHIAIYLKSNSPSLAQGGKLKD